MKNFFALILVFCCIRGVEAQKIARITDADSGETIPFASISVGNESMISNSEGNFTFSDADPDAKLIVSCIGFVGRIMTVNQLQANDNTIKLTPAVYQLDDVTVSRPDANSIMKNVKQNLSRHYSKTIPVAKDLIFVRESHNFTPEKMDIEVTESTGFSKASLAQANTELRTFTNRMRTSPPKEYTDKLCNLYLPAKGAAKVKMIKATKLRDENRGISMEQIEQKLTTLMLKHLDTMKYYRIKSGWIGSRDTVSLRKDYNKKSKKVPTSELTSAKNNLTTFLDENTFAESSRFDFVTQPDNYEYIYEGAIFMNENDLVYELKFKPRKSKANYTGKLYVSADDYAVLRTDYSLAKGKTEGGINLKWVLGVKASENVSRGTTIYKKNPSGEGYYLRYATIESGQYFYVHRPLKFIELAQQDKDVVEFDIKVEGNLLEKTEFLNITRTETTEGELAEVLESDFKYIPLKRYDPTIWTNYSLIEPLAELKKFTVVE